MTNPASSIAPVFEADIAALRGALWPLMQFAFEREEAGQVASIVFGVARGTLTMATTDHALRVTLRTTSDDRIKNVLTTPEPSWYGRAVEIPRDELTKVLRGLPGTIAAPPTGAATTVRFFADGDAWRAEVADEHVVSPAFAAACTIGASGTTGEMPLTLAWAVHTHAVGAPACDDDEALRCVLESANRQISHRDVDVFRPMLREWVDAVTWWSIAESPEQLAALRARAAARLATAEWTAHEWDRTRVLEVLRRGPATSYPIALADRAILSTVSRLTTGEELNVSLLPSETKRALALDTDAVLREIAAATRAAGWTSADLERAVDAPDRADRAACDVLISGQVREIDSVFASRVSGLPSSVLLAALLVHVPEQRETHVALVTADESAVADALARDWPADQRLSAALLSSAERTLTQRHKLRTGEDRIATLQRQGEERRQVKRLRGREDAPSAFLARDDGTSPLMQGSPPVRRAAFTVTDVPAPVDPGLRAFDPGASKLTLPPAMFLISARCLAGTIVTDFNSARWVMLSRDALAVWSPDTFKPVGVEQIREWTEAPTRAHGWFHVSAAEAIALRAIWGERQRAKHASLGNDVDAWYIPDGDRTIINFGSDAEMVLEGQDRIRVAAAALKGALGSLAVVAENMDRWKNAPAVPISREMDAALIQIQSDFNPRSDAEDLQEGRRLDPDVTTLSVKETPHDDGAAYLGLGRERRKDADRYVLVGQRTDGAVPTAVALVNHERLMSGHHFASHIPDVPGRELTVRVRASSDANAPLMLVRLPLTVLLPHPDTVSGAHIRPAERMVMRSVGMEQAVVYG